jgi:hypothetical protein
MTIIMLTFWVMSQNWYITLKFLLKISAYAKNALNKYLFSHFHLPFYFN